MPDEFESAGDREAAGAIAGMLEVYGAPRAEPVTEPRWVPAVDGSASHVGIDMANGSEPVTEGIPLDLLVIDPSELEPE